MAGQCKAYADLVAMEGGFPQTYEAISDLKIGQRAPALTRSIVAEPWQPCVLLRTDQCTLSVFKADGVTADGTVSDELGRSAAVDPPPDDSLRQEWEL
eukprot:6209286-Pleurochrysis_carterae.AAC.1